MLKIVLAAVVLRQRSADVQSCGGHDVGHGVFDIDVALDYIGLELYSGTCLSHLEYYNLNFREGFVLQVMNIMRNSQNLSCGKLERRSCLH